MPTVPYEPVQIPAQDVATPSLHIQTPGAAFGTEIGRAIKELGGVTEHVGNELFHRAVALQQLANETEAKEADAHYMMEVGKLHANFSALQGADAHAAFPQYINDIQGLRQNIRGSLSNDMARRMYDSHSLGTMGRTIFNGAGHAAVQMKMAADHAASARIDQALNRGYTNPEDEVGFNDSLKTIRNEVSARADLGGWLPEQTSNEQSKAESKAISMRVAGLAKIAPWNAHEMMLKYRDRIREDDFIRLQNTVVGQMNAAGARNIVDGVIAKYPDDEKRPSANKLVEEAVKEAKDKFPDLPDLPNHVEGQMLAKLHRIKAADRDFENQNVQTIYSAINKAYDEKRNPINIDEVANGDESIRAAYDALPDKKQFEIRKAIETAAKKGGTMDPIESLRLRDMLVGRAQTDPDGFMATDLYSKDLPLTKGDRAYLTNIRGKMESRQQYIQNVNRALALLKKTRGSELQELNIYNRTEQYKDDYDHYVGTLASAVEIFHQENKRFPSDEEIVDKIGPMILKHSEGSWLKWTKDVPPIYNVEVPEKWANDFKATVLKDSGTEPTDAQVRRTYIQLQLRELYRTQKEAK